MSGKAFWDTNLFIYWIEQAPPWLEKVNTLAEWQRAHSIRTVTSSLTLAELLVRPISTGQTDLVDQYQRLVTQLGCLSFGPTEARRFAEIRAAYPQVKPPDAIQLACAAQAGVALFLTNDDRLSKVRVKGISRIESLGAWYKTVRND